MSVIAKPLNDTEIANLAAYFHSSKRTRRGLRNRRITDDEWIPAGCATCARPKRTGANHEDEGDRRNCTLLVVAALSGSTLAYAASDPHASRRRVRMATRSR